MNLALECTWPCTSVRKVAMSENWVSSKIFMLRMVRDQTSRPEASDPRARGPLIRLGLSYDHVVMGSGDNNWIHIILACFFHMKKSHLSEPQTAINT